MLTSYKMDVVNGLLHFPQAMKEPFLATRDLVLRDGSRVSPAEIWHFVTEEAPHRFPWAFTSDPNAQRRLPYQVEFLSSIKYQYLNLSRRFRIETLKRSGHPLVYVHGGQLLDIYYAAGAIPQRPSSLGRLANSYVDEGHDANTVNARRTVIREEGDALTSMESCAQLCTFVNMSKKEIPMDLAAPMANRRCSDVLYLVESVRDQIPTLIVDYPINQSPEKPWMVEYVATSLRRLVEKIDSMTGRKTTEQDIAAQIKVWNRVRRLSREFMELWWSAAVPPGDSIHTYFVGDLFYDCMGDPGAVAQILEEWIAEVKERAEHSVKGMAISDNPVRLFSCGSCFNLDPHAVDEVGGVWLGRDDRMSLIAHDIEETGDPYQNFARAVLAMPYELPTVERAWWVADLVRKSRADGLVFGYNWGCNNQAAIAKMICDIVKREAGIPTMTLEVSDLERLQTSWQVRNRIEAFVEMISNQRLSPV